MANRLSSSSMFLQRLLLLAILALLVAGGLVAQAVRLTGLEGDRWLEQAEGRMVREQWTPTTRGRILDRKGRVLAVDIPAFDVEVRYDAISGEWAQKQASKQAWREMRGELLKLDEYTTARIIEEQYLPAQTQRLERMWDELADALGKTREEIDEERDRITARVEGMASSIQARWYERRYAELNRGREEAVEVPLSDWKRPIREQQSSHPIAAGITDAQAFKVRRLAEQYELIAVQAGGTRRYPLESQTIVVDRSTFPSPIASDEPATVEVRGVATHLLGWMRELDKVGEGQPLDTERRPLRTTVDGVPTIDRGHYRIGDLVGATGIEATAEDTLRGERGQLTEHLDTGQILTLPHEPGDDVRLTLDIALQARIQALLDPELGLAKAQVWQDPLESRTIDIGTPLNAAVVVLDVNAAEILAMVSTPSFTREDREQRPDWVYRDPIDAPWVNRACAVPYAAGSIVKPLVLVGATTLGEYILGSGITCNGHLLESNPNILRCWGWRPQLGRFLRHSDQFNGPVNAVNSLAVSCNIFYYTLGRRLGPERLVQLYKDFGIESLPSPLITPAYAGNAGRKYDGSPLILGDAIQMGIGQGPVDWTPLHAADAFATLARGGIKVAPRLMASEPVVSTDLRLDQAAIDAALEGLRAAVSEPYGTGFSLQLPDGRREPLFNIEGVVVRGKTGTATSTPLVADPDGDGPLERTVLREGDHAWFVGLVGPTGGAPKYAIAVMVEYGGSGGRVSGSIAKQVMQALIAEGYL